MYRAHKRCMRTIIAAISLDLDYNLMVYNRRLCAEFYAFFCHKIAQFARLKHFA